MSLVATTPPLRRRRRWILLAAAAGLSGYTAYRVYHLPSVCASRRRLSALLRALTSLAEAAAASAETAALVSSDLNRFLRSDSDEIPITLKQISKIAVSPEFSASLSSVSESLTVGIIRGFRSSSSDGSTGPGFSYKLLDKLVSPSGTGFVSVVVGSFARNLVTAFYSREVGEKKPDSLATPGWLCAVCSNEGRELVADSIQRFVSTAVAVFLDKTMDINTYDEIFAGLTNPKHEAKVKDLLVTVCSSAVETLVKSSHRVLTGTDSSSLGAPRRDADGRSLVDSKGGDVGGWMNERFVLDVTGRVTYETVRSFLEFVLRKLCDGAARGANVFREEVVERGREVVRFFSAKSIVIMTICLTLCLRIMTSTKLLMPA